MRKFLNLLIVAALLTLALGVMSASAQTITPWTTGIDLQNLSDSNANYIVDFYNASGAKVLTYTPPQAMAPRGSANIYIPNLTDLPSNTYSGVVSSDQMVAAVVSLNSYSSSDPQFGGGDIYLGTSAPANSLTFPLVYRNHTARHWYTKLVVQNASASSQTVTLRLYNSGQTAAAVTKEQAIPGYASYTFDLEDSAYSQFGPYGSATVSGSASLAGVASNILKGRMTNPSTNYLDTISTDYRAFSSDQVGQDVVLPLVYRNYNLWTTGINIVNPNDATTVVHVTYASGSNTWTEDVTVAGHAMQSIFTPSSTSGLPDGFYGSAKLHSDSATIAVVVASQRYRTTGAEGVAYEGSRPADATNCVSLPVTHNRSTWKTGINLLNMSDQPNTVTLKYYSSAGGIPNGQDQQVTLDPNQPKSIYMPTSGQTQLGFYGAVDVRGTQPLLVNVANSRNDTTSHGVASNYVGVNYACP